MTYRYLGDRMTDSKLKGKACTAVTRTDGKCIRGRHGNMLVEFDGIQQVFQVMNKCPQHTFQVLTKRSDLLEKYSPYLNWTPNIWMGVSVEDSRMMHRIDGLRNSGALIKFLSMEPLLGPAVGLSLKEINWVIVGGESGPKARSMKKEWVEHILLLCQMDQVAFFFKQWGGRNKKVAGRLLNGQAYDEMPRRITI